MSAPLVTFPAPLLHAIDCMGLHAGCTNPGAANYNPSATADDGTCTFVVPESDKELSGDLYTYVTSSLSSLWGRFHTPLRIVLCTHHGPMHAPLLV